MTRSDLLKNMKEQISDEEREMLAAGSGLIINQFNRQNVLRLLSMNDPFEGSEDDLDESGVYTLRDSLHSYLKKYMAEQPDAHKWIVISCLFQTFIAKEPMHPQSSTKWTEVDGHINCPAYDPSEGSLCKWCVCEP